MSELYLPDENGAIPLAPVPGPAEPAPQPSRTGLTPLSLFLVLLLGYVIIRAQLVLVLVILSILFATVIERPVGELAKRHIPRGLAILMMYALIIGGIILGSILASPLISDQAAEFREKGPTQVRDLRNDWQTSDNGILAGPGKDLLDSVLTEIDNPSSPPREVTVGIVTGVGGGLLGALTVFVIAFYYLTEKLLLRQLVLSQVRLESRERVTNTWDAVEAQLGRWLRGQFTLCLIIGTLSLIGYGALGVQFWPLLGLWAGITEIIPIVGPWLGGAPAVIIAMTQGWDKAIMVAIFVVILQFLENSILVPRVMRGAVGLSPLTVFVAILAGTQMLGIVGALLAIPVAAAVQVVLSQYLEGRRLANRAAEPALPSWRWMRGPSAALAPPTSIRPPAKRNR